MFSVFFGTCFPGLILDRWGTRVFVWVVGRSCYRLGLADLSVLADNCQFLEHALVCHPFGRFGSLCRVFVLFCVCSGTCSSRGLLELLFARRPSSRAQQGGDAVPRWRLPPSTHARLRTLRVLLWRRIQTEPDGKVWPLEKPVLHKNYGRQRNSVSHWIRVRSNIIELVILNRFSIFLSFWLGLVFNYILTIALLLTFL